MASHTGGRSVSTGLDLKYGLNRNAGAKKRFRSTSQHPLYVQTDVRPAPKRPERPTPKRQPVPATRTSVDCRLSTSGGAKPWSRTSRIAELRKRHARDFDTAIGLYGDRHWRPVILPDVAPADAKPKRRGGAARAPIAANDDGYRTHNCCVVEPRVERAEAAVDAKTIAVVDTAYDPADFDDGAPVASNVLLDLFAATELSTRLLEERVVQQDHREKVSEWLSRSEAANKSVQTTERRRSDVEPAALAVDAVDADAPLGSKPSVAKKKRSSTNSSRQVAPGRAAFPRSCKYINLLNSITKRIERLNSGLDEQRAQSIASDVSHENVRSKRFRSVEQALSRPGGRLDDDDGGTQRVINNLHSMMQCLLVGRDAATRRRRRPAEPTERFLVAGRRDERTFGATETVGARVPEKDRARVDPVSDRRRARAVASPPASDRASRGGRRVLFSDPDDRTTGRAEDAHDRSPYRTDADESVGAPVVSSDRIFSDDLRRQTETLQSHFRGTVVDLYDSILRSERARCLLGGVARSTHGGSEPDDFEDAVDGGDATTPKRGEPVETLYDRGGGARAYGRTVVSFATIPEDETEDASDGGSAVTVVGQARADAAGDIEATFFSRIDGMKRTGEIRPEDGADSQPRDAPTRTSKKTIGKKFVRRTKADRTVRPARRRHQAH